MILVDKDINEPNRKVKLDKSVFSIGDYRHNLTHKYETELHMSKVNQKPKEFLTWREDLVAGKNLNKKLKNNKA